MKTLTFNRAAYMAGECSHDEYYRQFATPELQLLVMRHIGFQTIVASEDEFFNDIGLYQWDRIAGLVDNLVGSAIALSNASTTGGIRTISLSDLVSAAKAAARQVKRDATERESLS